MSDDDEHQANGVVKVSVDANYNDRKKGIIVLDEEHSKTKPETKYAAPDIPQTNGNNAGGNNADADLEYLLSGDIPDVEKSTPADTAANKPSRALRIIIGLVAIRFLFSIISKPISVDDDISGNTHGEWEPTIDGHKPIINGFGEGSSVHILQVANKEYFTIKNPYAMNRTEMVEVNKRWATCLNYTHQLKLVPKTGNMYTAKVQAILDALIEVQENDWIIFLDGDVQFQFKHSNGNINSSSSCSYSDNTLAKIIPLESDDYIPCGIIAMTSSVSINTGVMLFKSTNATQIIVQKWIKEQQRSDKLLSFGAADQLSLQEVVLQTILGGPKIYTPHKCSSGNDQGKRNFCFRDNLPMEYRSSKNMCFVSCHDDHPLQCADCGKECNRSKAIFLHDNKRERSIANR